MIIKILFLYFLFFINLPLYAGDLICGEHPWSKNPGAFEAQLKRKCSSYYFPVSQRKVTNKEIESAKSKDLYDYDIAKKKLFFIKENLLSLDIEIVSFDLLNEVRQDLDDFIFYSLGIGGDGVYLADEAQSIRINVISVIKELYQGNVNALFSIEKAIKFHNEFVAPLRIPFIAQSTRQDSPIKSEDFLYSLMSESPETITMVIGQMPEKVKPDVRLVLLSIINEAIERGEIEHNLIEKISAINGS